MPVGIIFREPRQNRFPLLGVKRVRLRVMRPRPVCGEELLEALADPVHDEHEAMKESIGRPFDPAAFSVVEANRRLRKRLRLAKSP